MSPERTPAARVDQIEVANNVQRVARRIEALFQRRALLTHDLFTPSVTRDRVLPIDVQSLTDHWSMPIAGPTASTETLTRLVSSVVDRTQIERKADWTDSATENRSAVVAESLPKHPRQISQSSFTDHVPRSSSRETDHATENLSSEIRSESPLANVSEVDRWSGLVPTSAQPVPLFTPTTAPAIAPPSLTPSLPPLHSQKQDDVVPPIAAATAQRHARFEERVAHEEDLALLAERMERILKQEARRHGIDV